MTIIIPRQFFFTPLFLSASANVLHTPPKALGQKQIEKSLKKILHERKMDTNFHFLAQKFDHFITNV